MTLNFLDDMSFYDCRRRQMRFVGHVGSRAISFRIDLDAFFEGGRDALPSETDCLTAFNSKLSSIHIAARTLYSHGSRSSYVLSRDDIQ